MKQIDGPVSALAARQHGLFSRRQALGLGVTPGQIDRRLRTGRWAPHRPGVLVIVGSGSTWQQRVMGCCLASEAPATHRASAALWSLPEIWRPRPELTVEHGRRIMVRGAVVHQSKDLHKVEIVLREGIPTTPLTRAVLDVGAVMAVDDYGVFVRQVVRGGHATWDELHEVVVVHGRRGRDGVGRLRTIVEAELGLVPTESEFEHLVEQLLVLEGLPRPDRQHLVNDVTGGLVARIDLAYPQARLAIELDGEAHHSDGVAFERDRVRQNELVLLGWTVLRFTWAQLVRTPWIIVQQVRDLLRQRNVA
jgi:very-short-patch-repair endonuclease